MKEKPKIDPNRIRPQNNKQREKTNKHKTFNLVLLPISSFQSPIIKTEHFFYLFLTNNTPTVIYEHTHLNFIVIQKSITKQNLNLVKSGRNVLQILHNINLTYSIRFLHVQQEILLLQVKLLLVSKLLFSGNNETLTKPY